MHLYIMLHRDAFRASSWTALRNTSVAALSTLQLAATRLPAA